MGQFLVGWINHTSAFVTLQNADNVKNDKKKMIINIINNQV